MNTVASFRQLKELVIKGIGISVAKQIAQLKQRLDNLPNVPVDAITMNSTTENSTKRFKLTVDDSGAISAAEVTE